MFTGIVEDVGHVERSVGGSGGGRTLTIRTSLDSTTIKVGDSISVNGVCLTATSIDGPRFTVDAGPETLSRTTVRHLQPGSGVNLERAMAVGDRLGGHLVQGHVDGVGHVLSVTASENAHNFVFQAPKDLLRFIAPRGSITIEGISLTVTTVRDDTFGVMIIPHTWQETVLSERKVGDAVNLEVDVIARYVDRILDERFGPGGGLSAERMQALGY